jgi:hypothetical protein
VNNLFGKNVINHTLRQASLDNMVQNSLYRKELQHRIQSEDIFQIATAPRGQPSGRITMRQVLLISLLILVSSIALHAQGTSVSNATAIPPNGTGGGTITDQFTNQYWKVTTTTDGYLRFQLTPASGLVLYMVLYDTDGTTTLVGSVQTEAYAYLKPGTYYLLVYKWSGTNSSYTVATSFSSPSRSTDPEPNNTPATATILSPSGLSTGHIGYLSGGQTDTDDYWKITTTEDGWLRVQVRSDSLNARGERLDFNVILYDINGTSSMRTDNQYGTFSQVDLFLRPGTYYVRVWIWSGTAGSYEIKSDFFAPPLGNDQDGNDTYQTALTVPVNGSATGHLGYFSNNTWDYDDYWKFTTTTDGKIVVTAVSDSLDRSGGRIDLNLIVYDVNGSSSITTDTRSGTVSECITYLRPGTYYARLYLWSGGGASYRISIAQTTPSRTNDAEGNDWFGSATALGFGVQSSGHLGYFSNAATDTKDYWRLVAPSSDSIYVHVISDSTVDLNVVAYGSDSTFSITSDSRSGTYSRLGIKPTSGATYYFNVYLWSGTAGSYSILATRSATAVSVEPERTASTVPHELFMDQNYPNPFNPSTSIQYGLPEREQVRITIFSMLGQEIAELANTVQSPGSYRVVWNGKDHQGQDMPSGIYLIRLQTGSNQLVKKAMLLR